MLLDITEVDILIADMIMASMVLPSIDRFIKVLDAIIVYDLSGRIETRSERIVR